MTTMLRSVHLRLFEAVFTVLGSAGTSAVLIDIAARLAERVGICRGVSHSFLAADVWGVGLQLPRALPQGQVALGERV